MPAVVPSAAPTLPDAIAAQLASLGPRGPVFPVDLTKTEANWSNFTLKDGTILRIRPELSNVQYEPGRYNQSGEPIYHFQIGFAVASVVPPQLMQGFRQAKKVKKKASRKASRKKK